MILVNVLLIVALAAGVLTIMLSGEDVALQRASRFREAAQAQAIARGGELSAIAALRRDAIVAPASDNAAEPWANIGDRGAKIAGGSFDLAIADAQGRFNINALARGDVLSRDLFARLCVAAGLRGDAARRIEALIVGLGTIDDLRALARADVAEGDIARLAPLMTALPEPTTINVNAATEPLLAVLLANPAAARRLVAIRDRTGAITRDDVALANAVLPPGAGFASDYFWVRTRATVGDTSQQLTTLLRRGFRDGRPAVLPVARWRGSQPPLQAPALPAG